MPHYKADRLTVEEWQSPSARRVGSQTEGEMLVSFFIVDAHRNEILLRYFCTPDDRSIQVNGQIVYARFFTTAPGRDDFHSKSCLYKSRLLLPVNVCVFIIVPTFDGAGHAGYQEIYAKGYCSNVMLRKSKRSTLATALGAASLLI